MEKADRGESEKGISHPVTIGATLVYELGAVNRGTVLKKQWY